MTAILSNALCQVLHYIYAWLAALIGFFTFTLTWPSLIKNRTYQICCFFLFGIFKVSNRENIFYNILLCLCFYYSKSPCIYFPFHIINFVCTLGCLKKKKTNENKVRTLYKKAFFNFLFKLSKKHHICVLIFFLYYFFLNQSNVNENTMLLYYIQLYIYKIIHKIICHIQKC